MTSYFNPVHYHHRLANYRIFRARLNVPLIAVELAYGPDFELGDDAAEILIRLRATDVMWQKERLLNIALKTLPVTCRKVAWLDCDIVFAGQDWAPEVSRLLDHFKLLQVFSRAHHMPADVEGFDLRPETAEFTRASAVSAIAGGLPAAQCLGEDVMGGQFAFSRGYAWAARRELLDSVCLYDGNVIGGGDRAMACAAFGLANEAARVHTMTDSHRRHYLAWAGQFHKAVGGAVGFADCDLFHLWHGEMKNRRATERHSRLSAFDFDPSTDIATDANGCWQWASAKPDLHAYVREYFTQRKEDG